MAFVLSRPPVVKSKAGINQPFHRKADSRSQSPSVARQEGSSEVSPPISIGAIDDEHEHEADAVADAVVSGAALHTALHPSRARVQRACSSCSSEEEEVQMKADTSGAAGASGQTSSSVSAGIHRLRRAGGRPLPQPTSHFMKQRFNRDFGHVRVHTGAEANQLNRALSAKAFTVGNDLFFGRNQFQPQHREGKRLIAHELTHTLQQAQTSSAVGVSRAPLTIRRTALTGRKAAAESGEMQAETSEACEASKPDAFAWEMDRTLAAVRTAEPGSGRDLLRSGSSGPAVKRIQQALQAWGCKQGEELLPKYGADGDFGGETKSAVKAFQRVHGGGVDGIVGPLTMFHLDMFVVGTPLTGGGGIVVDENFEGEMGEQRRMDKKEFIAMLETEACDLARKLLANTNYSFEDCSALVAFIDFIATLDAGEIEQAIIAGTPGGARALSARQLVDAVLQQIRSSISKFLGGQDIGSILAELDAPDSVIKLAKEEMGIDGGGATQKKEATSGGGATLSPTRVQQQLRGQGRPLEVGVRSRMESAMASEFGGVRVHTGPEAAKLASSMHARAFTVGNDVGFAPGEYRPGNLIGDALIAHELAHVQQQSGATEEATGGAGSSRLEDAADESALGAMLRMGGSALSRLAASIGAVGAKTMPRLRSGLRLSRCNSPAPRVTNEMVPKIGDVKASKNKQAKSTMEECGIGLLSPGQAMQLFVRLDGSKVTRKGKVSLVQKVNSCREAHTNSDGKDYHLPLMGLDKSDPYEYSADTILNSEVETQAQVQKGQKEIAVGMNDAPHAPFAFNLPQAGGPKVADKITINDKFRVYVTWLEDGASADSRQVIGTMDWALSGSAQNTGASCSSLTVTDPKAEHLTSDPNCTGEFPPPGLKAEMSTPVDPTVDWEPNKCPS